jgi:hypothetical protein
MALNRFKTPRRRSLFETILGFNQRRSFLGSQTPCELKPSVVLDFVKMTRRPSLFSTRCWLAQNVAVGTELLVYFPNGGTQKVNLSRQTGPTLNVKWFDATNLAHTAASADCSVKSFSPCCAKFLRDGILPCQFLWQQLRESCAATGLREIIGILQLRLLPIRGRAYLWTSEQPPSSKPGPT